MDERLRALERQATHDTDAGWARLAALARTRGRRELYLEVARLARGGDAAARDALARWLPLCPPPVGPSDPAGPGWSDSSVALEAAWLDPMSVLGASEEQVIGHRGIGQGLGKLVAFAPGASGPRWSADTGNLLAWRGDDLVHSTPRGKGGSLLVRDVTSGDVVGELPVADRMASVAIEGDRGLLKLVLTGTSRAKLVGFDAGEAFGRVLWMVDAPSDIEVELGGGRCLVLEDTVLRAHDLETGAALWERHAPDETLEGAIVPRALLHADPLGAVLHGPIQDERLAATVTFDLATGATRWARRQDARELPALGPTVVVVGDGAGALVGIDRLSGETRWEARHAGVVHARASERVVVLARYGDASPADGRRPGVRRVTTLDAATGETLLESELDAPGSPAVSLMVGTGEALVAASSPGRLALLRLRRG